MATRDFTAKLRPTAKPFKFLMGDRSAFFFKDAFQLQTIILGGALIQIVLYAVLPARWAMAPVAIMLLSSVVQTILQILNYRGNAFMKGVIPGRTTAQLPSTTGRFGPGPASQSVVVFQLGIQWNHPLGLLAPGVMTIADQFLEMNEALHTRRDELGLLNVSNWRGAERGSLNTLLMTYYFKDVESIHRFAHEPLHRAAWDSYTSTKPAHIGVFHETFSVPARSYESMYVNCHPVLFGRSSVKCADGKDGEDWVNTLVSADTPQLKTQYARMGRDETGAMKPEYSE